MALLTTENNGQRLDNVNRTHLVLACGNLVFQKAVNQDRERKLKLAKQCPVWAQ